MDITKIQNIIDGKNLTKKAIENVNFAPVAKKMFGQKQNAYLLSPYNEADFINDLYQRNCPFIKFVVTWKIAEPGYKAKQANKETVYLFLSDKDISSEISRFMSVETNYFVQIKCTEEYKLTASLSMMQNIMNLSITIEIENFTVKDMMKVIIAYLKLNYTIDFEIEINNINAFGNVPSRSAFGNYMPMMFI